MTHTPAPWSASIDRHGFVTLSAGASYVKDTTDGFNIAGFLSPADAHLIAAAPDLLAALVAILKDIAANDGDLAADVFQTAKAAIAKVKGE